MVILIADDFADTRGLMRLLLEMKGHDVLEAANGREAVDVAIEHHPDLILMDVTMPIMDGLAATQSIRQHAETRAIPVVAVSSRMSEAAWRERAVRAGCDYCCAKPVDSDSLDGLLAVKSKAG